MKIFSFIFDFPHPWTWLLLCRKLKILVCFFLIWNKTTVVLTWTLPFLQCWTSAWIQLQQSSPQLAVAGTDGKFTRVCSCTHSDGCTQSVPEVSVFSSRGGCCKLWVAFVLWLHQGMLTVNSAPSVVGMLYVSQHPRSWSPNAVGSPWVPTLLREIRGMSVIRCGVSSHTWKGLSEVMLLGSC